MISKYIATLVLLTSYSMQSMGISEDEYVMCMVPMMTLVSKRCPKEYWEMTCRQAWKSDESVRESFENLFRKPQPNTSRNDVVGNQFIADMVPRMMQLDKEGFSHEDCEIIARILWQQDAKFRTTYQKYCTKQAFDEPRTLDDLPERALNVMGGFTKRSGKDTLKCVNKTLNQKIISQDELYRRYHEAKYNDKDETEMNRLLCYNTFTPRFPCELLDAIQDNNLPLMKHCISFEYSTLDLYNYVEAAMKSGNNADILNTLIGAEKSCSGMPLTLWAVNYGNIPMMRVLVNHGIDINYVSNRDAGISSEGLTALMYACIARQLELVKELITYPGLDINKKGRYGKSALILACGWYVVDYEIIRALLDAGAHVNVTDKYGQTALIVAAKENRTGIVKLLLENGADVNVIDENRKTAFTWAVWHNNQEMIQLLLDAGANVNVTDSDGQTALIRAVINNKQEIVQLLLNAHAHINITDRNGKTVLMYAKTHGHNNREIIKLLEDRATLEYTAKCGDLDGLVVTTGLSMFTVVIAYLFGSDPARLR